LQLRAPRKPSEHEKAALTASEAHTTRIVESAVVRALFPEDHTRRACLRVVGAATALAAIPEFLPLELAKEALA